MPAPEPDASTLHLPQRVEDREGSGAGRPTRPAFPYRLPRALRLLVLGSLAAPLAGCGGSHARPAAPRGVAAAPDPCRAALTVLPGAAHRASTGNNGAPECRLTRGPVVLVVNLDASPQPYMRLEREIVELGQQFGTVRNFSPPESVSHLGLDAAWLPDLSQVITANNRELITVTVKWPHARAATRRALAVRVARGCL